MRINVNVWSFSAPDYCTTLTSYVFFGLDWALMNGKQCTCSVDDNLGLTHGRESLKVFDIIVYIVCLIWLLICSVALEHAYYNECVAQYVFINWRAHII